MGDISIDALDDDGRSRRKAMWNQYIQMFTDQQAEAAPTQIEQVKHAGESRNATEMDRPAQGQQEFTPQQQTTKDVMVSTRTAKDWTKRIKTVPKTSSPAKARDLRSFEPSSTSRGAKQADKQHQHLGPKFAPVHDLDRKLASFALDGDRKESLKSFIPSALKDREELLRPLATDVAKNGTAEEKARFGVYQQWASHMISVCAAKSR